MNVKFAYFVNKFSFKKKKSENDPKNGRYAQVIFLNISLQKVKLASLELLRLPQGTFIFFSQKLGTLWKVSNLIIASSSKFKAH